MITSLVKLADECELITKGTTPSTLGFGIESEGVPFIRAQNIVDGMVSVEADPQYISRETHDALRRSQICPNDVVISIAGTIGRAGVVPQQIKAMNCNQAVAIIRPGKRLDCRFLLHWLHSQEARAQIEKSKVTATISNLSLGQIGNLQIPLPPFNEQRRIAAVLDKADALRRKRKRALKLLDALIGAVFLDFFGDPKHNPDRWPSLNFSAACSDVTAAGGKIQRSEYVEQGAFPVVDQGQRFVAGRSDQDEQVRRLDRAVIVFGDHTRAVKYVDFDFIVGADGAKVLRPSARFEPRFFAELLQRMPIPDLGYSRHMRALKELSFPCPPLPMQAEFGRTLTRIDGQRSQMQLSAEQLGRLFNSLQNRAFSGQL